MPDDRPHDVSGMTADQLARARRDLEISLALAFPGSPVRGPILNHLAAIDTELNRRSGWTAGGTGG
jgi:hypothetical protein